MLLGTCWGMTLLISALAKMSSISLHHTKEGGIFPRPLCSAGGRDRSSHLCLAAMGAVELVAALAQPGQAGLVLLAQRLQLRAQLRALQAQQGALSRRGPPGSVHTQSGRAAAAAAALHLPTGTGTAQLCCPSVLMNLRDRAQLSVTGSVGLGAMPGLPPSHRLPGFAANVHITGGTVIFVTTGVCRSGRCGMQTPVRVCPSI